MEPRRSPRFIELARLRELAETDKDKKKKQLRHAQYKARQEKITDHEKQALKERCRVAYQNPKTRVNAAVSNVQVSTSTGEHKDESSYVPRRSPRIDLQQIEL
ncbi:hypothetical protein MKW92_011529 [Papaver armeniacum]|nr:hypothetical protein MKW92_011529 [Papaver armeniacum]